MRLVKSDKYMKVHREIYASIKTDKYARMSSDIDQPYLLMGNVKYPLSRDIFSHHKLDKYPEYEYTQAIAKEFEHYSSVALVLKVSIGKADFSASREELSYTPLTLSTVYKIINNTLKHIEKLFLDAKTLEEWDEVIQNNPIFGPKEYRYVMRSMRNKKDTWEKLRSHFESLTSNLGYSTHIADYNQSIFCYMRFPKSVVAAIKHGQCSINNVRINKSSDLYEHSSSDHIGYSERIYSSSDKTENEPDFIIFIDDLESKTLSKQTARISAYLRNNGLTTRAYNALKIKVSNKSYVETITKSVQVASTLFKVKSNIVLYSELEKIKIEGTKSKPRNVLNVDKKIQLDIWGPVHVSSIENTNIRHGILSKTSKGLRADSGTTYTKSYRLTDLKNTFIVIIDSSTITNGYDKLITSVVMSGKDLLAEVFDNIPDNLIFVMGDTHKRSIKTLINNQDQYGYSVTDVKTFTNKYLQMKSIKPVALPVPSKIIDGKSSSDIKLFVDSVLKNKYDYYTYSYLDTAIRCLERDSTTYNMMLESLYTYNQMLRDLGLADKKIDISVANGFKANFALARFIFKYVAIKALAGEQDSDSAIKKIEKLLKKYIVIKPDRRLHKFFEAIGKYREIKGSTYISSTYYGLESVIVKAPYLVQMAVADNMTCETLKKIITGEKK